MSASPGTQPFGDLGLRGSAIIVTGAGSGIGAAAARLLSQQGAAVALVGRRAAALHGVARSMEGGRARALCVPADLAEPGNPRRIVDTCLERYGRLDGLVNNAAVVRHRPLPEWDADGFDKHVATNVRAPFFLIQAALPALRESPLRAVVNISSSSGTLRRRGQSVYGMTKCALDYLTQSLAGELASSGVRVNGIAPGPIDTPVHATWADDLEEARRWLTAQVPLGRIGTAEEVAGWIALLLSPLSSFMTGTIVSLDGGQTIDRD